MTKCVEEITSDENQKCLEEGKVLPEMSSRSQKVFPFTVICNFIPILNWLPKYSVRENLFADVVGGLTVGFMHVPQGMAYASLAGLPPVHGLYTSLFPPLIYMIFGTSRHVSLGVFAIVSLITGACNVRVTNEIIDSSGRNFTTEEETSISISVVMSLALLVGIIQVFMGIMRLDYFTSYLSDNVIKGFTTGAAVHVFTAQLNKILGVALPRHSGPGGLYFIYKGLIQAILDRVINYPTLIISLTAIAFIFVLKLIVDPQVKKKCPLPIPYDLLVIILTTLISTMLHFHDEFHVKVIGKIPTGLPKPKLPDLTLFPYIVGDAFAISIVSFVVTVSMAKLFAKKHGYTIDPRQEFFALGLMEAICSVFPCWPSSTALARTLVNEAAGTRTQLSTIFSSMLLLSVLFYFGVFVEQLPVCLLSAIIICALRGMFLQLKMVPILYKVSKLECAEFLVAFFATVVFNVLPGLAIGVTFSIVTVLVRIQRRDVVINPERKYRSMEDGVIELKFDAPLIFLTVERFREQIERIVDEKKQVSNSERKSFNMKLRLDFSSVPFIDLTGAMILSDLERLNVQYEVENINDHIQQFLQNCPDGRAREICDKL